MINKTIKQTIYDRICYTLELSNGITGSNAETARVYECP
jgi:hypothetical protein